jgi:hypothetical protein
LENNAMAFIPINNTAEIHVRGVLDNQHVENTLYFVRSLDIDAGSLMALALDVMDYWVSNMIPLLNTNYALAEVFARDLTTEGGFEATAVPGSPTHGTYDSATLPNNVTMCVSFRTGVAGRSARGRNYWATLTEGDVAANTISTTFSSAVVNAYAGMIGADTVSSSWQWVVASRYADGAPRPSGYVFNINAVLVVDNIVDSQRRRLPGRGR